ncbi:TetR/AcrR family transcriptional regulator [Nocardia crassostreae]|uniref:TetR/AcrR family transcriptional regulator n=1 Tax=Nocardia crassostreae TaxID=53428 RepID=UPI00083480CA|nr:TetR/AcrR family transcriptional regulator [Nocardia crassostreae]
MGVCQDVGHDHIPPVRRHERRRTAGRARFIAAGRELLAGEGLAKISITSLCAHAGLIDRYFYENFANLDAFLDDVADQIATEGAAAIYARVTAAGSDDPRERLRIVIEGSLDELTGEPVFARMLADLRADDQQGKEMLLRHREALTGKVADLTGQYVELVFGSQRYEAAQARAAIVFVVGGSADMVTNWLTGKLDLSREEFIETCTNLLFSAGMSLLEMLSGLPGESLGFGVLNSPGSTGPPVGD